jgi:cytochrome c oxidase subunit 1
VHLNWGDELPVVHRWAYAYSVPGARDDFIPQNAPPEAGGDEPEQAAPPLRKGRMR